MVPFKLLGRDKRAYFYGLVMGIGMVLLHQLAISGSFLTYVIGIAVLSIILLLEITTSYLAARKLLDQLDLPQIEIYTGPAKLILHWLLPIIFYISSAGFIYVNPQPFLAFLYLVINFSVFSLLFINIRAYYEDKYNLEAKTHFVYDVIKIVILFNLTDLVLNLAHKYSWEFFIIVALVFTYSSFLTGLVIIRKKQINYFNIILMFFAGLALGYLTAVLDVYLDARSLLVSFYAMLIFYIFNAILHHEIEKTLNLPIVIEYFLVAAICFLMITFLP